MSSASNRSPATCCRIPTADQLVATGFHRNTLKNREGGVNFEQFRFEENVDRVSTIGTVWLGMTIGCAQCHDHKFDPISQKDFYRFFAFFNNIEEGFAPAPLPGELGPYIQTHDEYRAKRDELHAPSTKSPTCSPPGRRRSSTTASNPGDDTAWDVNWDTLAKMTDGGEKYIMIPAEQRTELQADVVTDYFLRFYTQIATRDEYKALGLGELRATLARLEESYPQMSQARTVFELDPPRPTTVHVRGGWDRPGIPVSPGVPGFLPPIEVENPNRLDLARWLFREDNPLTARVIVNRIWQEYFGQGLVTTSDDFGTQGDKPSHPELLDWLAQDFIDSGWSLKHLHRTIVGSATYQQSADARPELTQTDPDNRLLARQERLRLPGELIRDAALSAGGLLNDGSRRQERPSASDARRRVQPELRRRRLVGRPRRRPRPLPPRPLHSLPAHRSLSDADDLRRSREGCRRLLARTFQHAAAGAEPAQRSGVHRGRAGAWRRA